MIELAKAENIKVIFSQAEVDSRQPQAFAEEIGGTKEIINPLSADYINNLQAMAKAISGSVK